MSDDDEGVPKDLRDLQGRHVNERGYLVDE